MNSKMNNSQRWKPKLRMKRNHQQRLGQQQSRLRNSGVLRWEAVNFFLILQKSLETLASLLLNDLRLWKEQLEKQELKGDLKESKKESHFCTQNGFSTNFLLLTDLTLLSPGKQVEFQLQHPPVLERFFFGRCPVNPNENKSLKACSGCNSICYSTKEAQKSDWKRHKSICKALQQLGKWLLGKQL